MDGITKPPGFTNRPNQKPIEAIVRAYLRLITSGARLREERKFIIKAIIMINQVFGHPCCDIPTSVIDYGTPYDNQLTNTIRNMIINGNVIRRSFRLALTRILNILNEYLYDCCTETLTVSFTTGDPTDLTVNFTDVVTGDVLFSTTTIGGTTQTITLPAKYFGMGALIKVCMNIISAPTSPAVDTVLTGVQILVSSGVVGSTCSTILQPAKNSYTVTEA